MEEVYRAPLFNPFSRHSDVWFCDISLPRVVGHQNELLSLLVAVSCTKSPWSCKHKTNVWRDNMVLGKYGEYKPNIPGSFCDDEPDNAGRVNIYCATWGKRKMGWKYCKMAASLWSIKQRVCTGRRWRGNPFSGIGQILGDKKGWHSRAGVSTCTELAQHPAFKMCFADGHNILMRPQQEECLHIF